MVHGPFPQEFEQQSVKITWWKVQLEKKAKFKFKFEKIT